MNGCTVTSVDFDKLKQLILENQKLKEKVEKLTKERQQLVNENNNLKIRLKKMLRKRSNFNFELISEHKGELK